MVIKQSLRWSAVASWNSINYCFIFVLFLFCCFFLLFFYVDIFSFFSFFFSGKHYLSQYMFNETLQQPNMF